MTSFRFFLSLAAAILLGALLTTGSGLNAQQPPQAADAAAPSVLPPIIDDGASSTRPEPEETAPPESSKTALDAGSGDSLELTQEQEEQLRQITKVIYEVPPTHSGGGDAEIVEIPLSLFEALSQIQNSADRLAAVESYWSLRSSIAHLNIEIHIRESAEKAAGVLEKAAIDTPDFQALMAVYRVYLSSADARIAQLRVEIREGQIDLMRKTQRSTERGWPIPSSTPWYGNYTLRSEAAQSRSFELASEAILIPEKIRAGYASGFSLGSPENLFTPEISTFERIDDGYLYLKTLENKRQAALGYVRVLESLNDSIARYVAAYSPSIDSRVFVTCLIGNEEE
ncbi:MAG: hypothetical protein J6S42_04470 [Thermoguttaceae bacterium]|nr:hypothetical protein [Thermoguttaceae bacterium]